MNGAMQAQVAIVTGGSSGIGLETARALRARGVKVYALSRRPAEGEHVCCDVADPAAASAAVAEVLRREGRVDILVNCAGMGISGAFEYTDPADAARILEVNVLGMSNVLRAVLPAMRAQRSGRVVNVSSVAAVAPIPFQAWYSASKAAVNALTMAAANEVRPWGIAVISVMPGDTRTGFTASRRKFEDGDGVYGGRIARSVQKMERDEEDGMTAQAAGQKIAKIALSRSRRPVQSLGLTYKACAMLAKFLPARAVRFLLAVLYGR